MCVHNIFKRFKGMQYVGPTWPLSVQALCCRLCPILLSLCYDDTLVTLTVESLAADKFKPFLVSVLRFALSSVGNILILMILYDCLLNLVNFVMKPQTYSI